MIGWLMNFSVCIPTLNARATWTELTAALENQTAIPEEIIVVDSESDDGTAELAERKGFRVVRIARRDFRHGATRQLAADMAAHGDFIVYLTQDAILANPDALSALLRSFDNPEVGAAYGRQLPRKGARPIETHARLFNYPPVLELRSAESIASIGFKAAFLSNSFGAYRRTALQAVGGFPLEVNFGEDVVVGARLITQGWRIAYVSDALVFHSHNYTWSQEFQRYKSIGALHREHRWLLQVLGGPSKEGLRFVKSEIQMLAVSAPHLIPSAMIRNACKFLGYRLGRFSVRE